MQLISEAPEFIERIETTCTTLIWTPPLRLFIEIINTALIPTELSPELTLETHFTQYLQPK